MALEICVHFPTMKCYRLKMRTCRKILMLICRYFLYYSDGYFFSYMADYRYIDRHSETQTFRQFVKRSKQIHSVKWLNVKVSQNKRDSLLFWSEGRNTDLCWNQNDVVVKNASSFPETCRPAKLTEKLVICSFGVVSQSRNCQETQFLISFCEILAMT